MRDPWDRFAWWQSPALFGAPVGPAATSANSSGGILGNLGEFIGTLGADHGPTQIGSATLVPTEQYREHSWPYQPTAKVPDLETLNLLGARPGLYGLQAGLWSPGNVHQLLAPIAGNNQSSLAPTLGLSSSYSSQATTRRRAGPRCIALLRLGDLPASKRRRWSGARTGVSQFGRRILRK
jgi:hypothetical protein